MFGCGNGRQCIELIVDATQCPAHVRHFVALVQDLKIIWLAMR